MIKICPECLERVDDDLNFCPEDGTELREIHARDEDPMEGRVLEEKWVIESKIGGGGMGSVYRAHQLSVNRTVAIKILRSDLSEDDEHVERFFREANVASKVSDPRCVTIYDFGQSAEDHVLYLAMEYLDGEPLHDYLRRDQFTVRETVEIGIQIAAALESLHGLGIVHRDLKPENVFLLDDIGSDVFLKLLDFGLAKIASSDATPVTASGQVFGTPAFMSPEQCMGSDVGPRSDLYSLGCLLYELVSGQTPFASNVSVEVLLAHVNRPPPPVDESEALPPAYSELIMQLLEKDPANRPESSVAVRERLEEVRDGLAGMTNEHVTAPKLVDVEGEVAVERAELEADSQKQTRPWRPEEGSDSTEAADIDTAGIDDASRKSGRGGLILTATMAGTVGVALALYWNGVFDGVQGAESRGASAEEAEQKVAPEDVRKAIRAARRVRANAVPGASARSSGTAAGERMGARAVFLAGARTLRASNESETSRDNTVVAGRGGAGSSESSGGAGRETDGESASGTPGSGNPSGARGGGSERSNGGTDDESGAVAPVLTQETARQVFDAKSGEVVSCIEDELSADLSSTVTVQVNLIVTATGSVESVKIPKATPNSNGLKQCVEARARNWSFPPTSGGRMRVGRVYRYLPRQLDL